MRFLILLVLLPSAVMAWDGYDWSSNTHVEIGKGNLVRPGQTIEVYNYGSGSYNDYTVESIQGTSTGAEVEVYDWGTGEYRTFDME